MNIGAPSNNPAPPTHPHSTLKGPYTVPMSHVVLMCGAAGSGKSTAARELEARGMLRLSVDAEAYERGLRSMPLPTEINEEIITDLRRRLLDAVAEGRDVVVDLSFWSRAMREEWRALLAPTGATVEILHVVAARGTALARLRERAGAHADNFTLPPGLAELYHENFQPPGPDEGPVTVLRTDGPSTA